MPKIFVPTPLIPQSVQTGTLSLAKKYSDENFGELSSFNSGKIYLFKVAIETLEKEVEYVQS